MVCDPDLPLRGPKFSYTSSSHWLSKVPGARPWHHGITKEQSSNLLLLRDTLKVTFFRENTQLLTDSSPVA